MRSDGGVRADQCGLQHIAFSKQPSAFSQNFYRRGREGRNAGRKSEFQPTLRPLRPLRLSFWLIARCYLLFAPACRALPLCVLFSESVF
jgi:hypothetical protein